MDIKPIPAAIEEFIEETGLSIDECAELYTVFIEEIQTECQDLLASIKSGNVQTCGQIIHNIKGISGNYRVLVVNKIASDLDLKFKKKENSEIKLMITLLIDNVKSSLKEIQQFFFEKGIIIKI